MNIVSLIIDLLIRKSSRSRSKICNFLSINWSSSQWRRANSTLCMRINFNIYFSTLMWHILLSYDSITKILSHISIIFLTCTAIWLSACSIGSANFWLSFWFSVNYISIEYKNCSCWFFIWLEYFHLLNSWKSQSDS